jgi:hypothetical protein
MARRRFWSKPSPARSFTNGCPSPGRLIGRPTLFSQAVTLSIYGYHFRKTCVALEL